VKKWLIALIAAVSCAKVPEPKVGISPSDLRGATVALVEDGRPFCAGVWVSEDTIVTAEHCVRGSNLGDMLSYSMLPDFDYTWHSIEEHRAKLVSVGKPDLAVLRVSMPSPHPHNSVNIAEGVADGATVYTVGHPGGTAYVLSRGFVDTTRITLAPNGNEGKFVHVTSASWFGSSGGGAFDEKGDLVGICSFITKVPQQTYWVHPDEIRKILK
jgi:S1-C subfamily serine protease